MQTTRGQGSEGATPARPRATPAYSQGEEEQGDLSKPQRVHHSRVHHVRVGGREGDTLTGQRATLVCSQGEEEGRNLPKRQRAYPAHSMQ